MNHFKPEDFDSPDAPGSGANMDAGFLIKLEAACEECLFPWKVTSGFRTKAYNAEIGGAPDSWHAKGMACDIACIDSLKRYAIVQAAMQVGLYGIEVCDRHVHLDNRPKPCLWTDKSK